LKLTLKIEESFQVNADLKSSMKMQNQAVHLMYLVFSRGNVRTASSSC